MNEVINALEALELLEEIKHNPKGAKRGGKKTRSKKSRSKNKKSKIKKSRRNKLR